MKTKTLDKINALIPTVVPEPHELRELRESLGLTQAEYAEAFNVGIRAYQSYERGDTHMNPYMWEFMVQIAQQVKPVAEQQVVAQQPVAGQPINSVNKVADVSDIDDWISSKLSF